MIKIVDNTINKGIETIINHHIRQLPYPTKGTITKVYEDNKHIDVKTSNGTLEYVETVGNTPIKGNVCILLFLDGNSSNYICIV